MLKKLISVFLCVLTVFTLPASALAVANECSCGVTPVVFVRGFGSDLYLNPGTESQSKVFGPSTEMIMQAVPSIIKAVNSLLITHDNKKFIDSVDSVLLSLFSPIDCDVNGKSAGNVGAFCPLPTVDTHKITNYHLDAVLDEEKGDYRFEYDWRVDPLETADKLNEYINAVCELTGHGKIVLCAHSEGNCVTASYLSKYGSSKLEKLILMNSAANGLGLVGHLFTKDISVEGKQDALEGFIRTFLGGDPGGDMLTAIVSMLNDAGIIDKLLVLIGGVLDTQLDTLYDDVVIELFACMPGIWSFVPDEYYEDAKHILFGDNSEYAQLIDTIDNYHNNVQLRLTEILNGVKSSGVPVCVVSNYGISPIPVYDGCNEHCDMLIDTKYTSFGATCAEIGKELELTDTANSISPDGCIDASTCLFPDSTWFLKYQDHNDFCAASRTFVTWLIEFDGQPTVQSASRYSQFLTCTGNHAQLTPLQQAPAVKEYPNDFFAFFISLFKLMASVFIK